MRAMRLFFIRGLVAVASVCGFALPACADPAGFATPNAAVAALKGALAKDDVDALLGIFGPEYATIVLGSDPASGRVTRRRAAAAMQEKVTLRRDTNDRITLVVGRNSWPMPIPLVRRGDGWVFDSAAGEQEILARRIGGVPEHVVGGDVEAEFHVGAERGQRANRHRNTLRHSGGTGGEDHDQGCVATADGCRESGLLRVEQSTQREIVRLLRSTRDHHDRIRLFDLGPLILVGYDDFRRAGGEPQLDGRPGECGEQRDVDRAQAPDRQQGDDQILGLAHQGGDRISRLDTECGQCRRALLGPAPQLCVGQVRRRQVRIDDRERDRVRIVPVAEQFGRTGLW